MGSYPLQRNARLAATAILLATFAFTAPHAAARERALLDADWRFVQVDEPAPTNGEPAFASADFNDADWRTVNLPHDWSIEGAPAADQPSGGAGGYFTTGIGWYRKHFITPSTLKERRVTIEFEGVYHRATVWLNGHKVGNHAYGYTPFTFDVTAHLAATGEPNVLAVRVDNSAQPNCRWYSGSGIYRHVWLEAMPPVHLLRNELRIRTQEITRNSAELVVQVTVETNGVALKDAGIELALFDSIGPPIIVVPAENDLRGSLPSTSSHGFTFKNPKLWHPDSPHLYTLATRIVTGGRVIDEIRTPIGIRTVKVTPERGFELNGQPLKLFGGCVHHDNGPLGAAAFDRAEVRRVEILKAAGFNAIRTSHNPPSTAFLNACDRLGMLVVDEAFDNWAKKKTEHDYHEDFADNWQADLEAMIRRDRNHPSVVMWSIGNEMYERGEASGAKIAADMRAAVLALDATRPITAACNGLGSDDKWPGLDPVFASLDVAGYNYELDRIEPDHERLPKRVIQITESFQNEAYAAWDLVQRNPYLIGEFVWTAMDYLGEAGIGRVWAPGETVRQHWEGSHFPWHGAYCGDIDVTGHRKPISHERNIIWDRGEKLYATVIAPSPRGEPWQPSMWGLQPSQPSWTWPGAEGRELEVVVTSRHDAVRLYLNDKLLGEQPTNRDTKFQATFRVPYQPGQLRVVGADLQFKSRAGELAETESITLATANYAAKLRLTTDRTDLTSDRQDLAFVAVEITDHEGALSPTAVQEVTYSITGPAEIAAIGSGNLTDSMSYRSKQRFTYQGRALVVLRTTDAPGNITITAEAPGLSPATITLKSAAPK